VRNLQAEQQEKSLTECCAPGANKNVGTGAGAGAGAAM
jgi:hypothetical protein